ncbi:carboxypeptidase [Pseudoclavibacter endophyticus]|nr:carboxypeptidase [Pseudoclavibacter endophyticus]
MSGIAGVLVAAMVTPLIAVVGIAANSTITLFESLPDYLEITPLQQKTELYAMSNGEPVQFAEFYAQNREEVPLDSMSEDLQDAAIATEDPRYYEHGGVDVISAARAALEVLMNTGDAGASTITMQYVRNMRIATAESIMDPAARDAAYNEAIEVSIGRKLQEMRLAIGVDKQFSKDEILQGYLNIALFGGTVYGVESAANYYFSKSAADVTLPEAASLIAMVQEPNAYRLDVPENIEPNKERRDYILSRMLDEGKITQAEHDEAVASPVEPNITQPTHGCQYAGGNAKYFCDYVRNVILNDTTFGATYEERLFNFQTKGYQIYTSLDLDLQQTAEATMESAVPAHVEGMSIGSGASMVENGTGRILAMVQNTEFDETPEAAERPGHTSVNFNTDYNYGGSTGFQTGSAYKIFTLAEWVASGRSIGATVNAQTRPFNLANFQDSCSPDAPYGGSFEFTNDGGARVGNVSVLQATTASLNTGYMAMAEQLDQCRIRDTAIALGAHRADGGMNVSYPSAVLGINEIAPLSMATAISGLANNGMSCSPIAIDRIELRDGSELTPPASDCRQAVTPDVAAAVNTALVATANGGTAAPSNPGIAPMTGKTGTNDDAVHTWVVGGTTEVGMAVWVGNATGQTSLYNVGLPRAQASQTRHVIFNEIMADAMNRYGGGQFPPANDESTRPDKATIPDLSGRTTAEAKQVLEELGFQVAIGDAVASEMPAGTVASTIPSANTQVDTGTTVTVSPSNGAAEAGTITVPNLRGMTDAEAAQALADAGFTGTIFKLTESSADVPQGQVVRSDPAADTPVAANADVMIYVSSGP